MKPDAAASGPRPGVQHPGREQAVRALGAKGLREPVAAALHDLAAEFHEAAATETPVGLDPEIQPRPRPQLGAEDAEHELRL